MNVESPPRNHASVTFRRSKAAKYILATKPWFSHGGRARERALDHGKGAVSGIGGITTIHICDNVIREWLRDCRAGAFILPDGRCSCCWWCRMSRPRRAQPMKAHPRVNGRPSNAATLDDCSLLLSRTHILADVVCLASTWAAPSALG